MKNLKSGGLTSMGPSLKHAFDLLNVNRMQSGIDTYGQVSTCTWWGLASMDLSFIETCGWFVKCQ